MTARVITKTQSGNKSLAHARLQKQVISGLSLAKQTQFLWFCGHRATFRAAKGHFEQPGFKGRQPPCTSKPDHLPFRHKQVI